MATMKCHAIRTFMTPTPYTIGGNESLRVALDVMQRHNFRHLPVEEGGRLTGILSDRDINFALRIEAALPEDVRVIDAHTPQPYVVSPETPVEVVAQKMADDHIGSALIVENEKLIGIFTTVDACRVLAQLFTGQIPLATEG